MEHFVEFEDVCKYYQTGSVKIAAADHLNFYVDKGEFCIIVGPSGAGKTTLLNILGGMDSCDDGNVWLDGQNVSHFTARELTTYRRYDVGFVAVKWLTFWPSSQTLPSSQLSMPPRIFSRVVLPAPEGPTMMQNSPLST